MTRYTEGLWLAALLVGLGASCSLFSKDEDDNGGQGGASASDGGQGGAAEAPPCEQMQGLRDQACQIEERAAQPRGAKVLLVMDKSGSMSHQPPGYNLSKWEALRTALGTALDEVEGFIDLGLEFFPTTATADQPIEPECEPPRCCEMPTDSEMNVPIGRGVSTVPRILQAMQESQPAGGTPTGTALSRAYDYFTTGGGAALDGDRYVLLATDGGPNCNDALTCERDTCTLNLDGAEMCYSWMGDSCCDDAPDACLDDARTVGQIQRLAGIGVTTIVVGIPGAEVYSDVLQQFADAGGFVRPDGSTDYYAVSEAGGITELTATFQDITTQLVTDCEVAVGGEIPNPNVVNVAVDCVIVPQEQDPADTEDRWRFNDPDAPTSIIIDGQLCETIQQEGVRRIDVVLGCRTVTLY